MKHDSNDQISTNKKTHETGDDDINLQLDDLDDEIIDLVDFLEDDDSDSEAAPPSQEAAVEATDEEQEFLLEDLDLDDERGADEPSPTAPIGPIENDEEYELEVGQGAESELEEMFTEEEAVSDTPPAESEEFGAREDQITDEALAELFSSHEMEVAEMFQEATEASSKTDETGGEELPAMEGEIPKDIFADLELESELVTEETPAAAEPAVAEEELPEDVFADLETDSEEAADEAVTVKEPIAAEEKVPDEILLDLEAEPEELIAVAASPDAIEAGKAVAPAAAEELAALLSAQVNEVVTRLVEERLPSMVERAIAEEIEKIRTALESGK